MEDKPDAAHYRHLIDTAESYHDLVVFRSRFFSLLESTLPKAEFLSLKEAWQAKAKDESLPVAPPAKV